MNEIPPKLQNQIAQFQALQQQLNNILSQKFRMEAQLREAEMTIEELKKSPEDVVIYKSVGSLLIKAPEKDAVLKDVEDDKETLEVRIKTLERQEKSMRDKYQVMQDQLNKALGAAAPPAAPAEQK
ncbi:MAG TPA: prefoldin subunit beta [Methanomassiliicoccales archaeon]|nr:prefoldin subunit beta [Methanomassiliicoccales archaeon]